MPGFQFMYACSDHLVGRWVEGTTMPHLAQTPWHAHTEEQGRVTRVFLEQQSKYQQIPYSVGSTVHTV